MAAKLIMLRGLPASGKTTWAKEYQKQFPKNSVKRVNKDDLRSMLDAGEWSKGNEQFILQIRDYIVCEALAAGKHVIVDDTNFEDKHEKHLRGIAKAYEAEFVVKEFDVPVEECLSRDQSRPNSVGSKVIMDMYAKYLCNGSDHPIYRERRPGKKLCIICDIDGTLARHDKRGPYEMEKCETDGVYHHIRFLVNMYFSSGAGEVILISGRNETYRGQTDAWLHKWDIRYDKLFMRGESDQRRDSVIKEEIFHREVEPYYDVLFVLDDRNQVVDMWRQKLNIPCLQVNYGNF